MGGDLVGSRVSRCRAAWSSQVRWVMDDDLVRFRVSGVGLQFGAAGLHRWVVNLMPGPPSSPTLGLTPCLPARYLTHAHLLPASRPPIACLTPTYCLTHAHLLPDSRPPIA